MEPDQRRSEGEGAVAGEEADGRAEVEGTTSGGEVGPRQRVAPPESPGGDDGGGKEMRKKPPSPTNGNDRKVPNVGPRATAPGVAAVPRGGPDPAVAKGVAQPSTKQRVVVPQGPAAEATPSEESPVGLGSRMNQGGASVDVKQRPTARAAAPGAVAVSGPPPGGKVVDDSSATAPLGNARRVQRIAGASSSPSDDLSPGDEGGGGKSTTRDASGTGKPIVSSRATMPGVTSVSGKGPVKGGVVDPLASDGRVKGTDGPLGEPEKSTEKKVASTSSEGEELARRVLVAPTEPPICDDPSPNSSSDHSSAKPCVGERASTPGATAVAARGVDGTREGGRSPNENETRGAGAQRVQKIVAPSMRPSDAAVTVGAAAALTTSDAKPEVVERATAPGAVAVASNKTNSRVAAKVASATTPTTSPTGKKVATSPDDNASKGVDGTRTAGGSQTKTEMSQERREQRIVAPSRPSDTAAMTISAGAMLATSPAKPEVVERATAPGAVAIAAAATDRRDDRAAAKVASATGDAQRPRVQRVLSGRILPDATVDLEVDNRGKIPASSASASASSSPTQSSTATTGTDTKPKVQSRATAAGAVAVAGIGSASSSPSSSAASTGMGGSTDAKPQVRSRATAAGAVAVAGIGSAAPGGAAHGGTTAPEAAAAASRKRDDERVQRTAELRCPSDTAIGIQGGDGDGDGRETTATSGDADVKAKARAETKVRADAPGASSVGPTEGANVDEKIQAHGADREVGGGEAVVASSSESEEMERKRKEKIIAAARTLLNAGGAEERTIQQTEAPLSDDAVLEKVGSAGAIVGAGATTAHANTNLDNREQVVQTSAPSLAEHGDGGGGDDRVPAAGDEHTPPPGTGVGGGRSNPAPVSCELLVETSLQRGETPPADLVATGGQGMPASPPFMAPAAAVGNRSVGDGEKMGGNGYDTADTAMEAAADGVYKVPQDLTCRGRHPFLCGRRMLCCYAFVIVAVAIIVPSVLLTGGDGDGSSQTSAERVASFSEILAPISPTVQESGTPQNNALNWLATQDPAQLPSDGDVDRIVQRYVLACLYYSTNGEDWGDQLYFLSGDHECRWNEWNKDTGFLNGVTCYEGRVDYLMLPNNGLEGTIPSELQELSSMTRLALNSNLLSSTIPPELFNLVSLEHLGLQFNQLVGPISTHIGSLPDLTELNLSANSFNDTIPDSLGNLTKLELLVLHSNRFTGRVPDSFHNLESLDTLHLYGNSVTGNVTYMCDMGVTEITADCFEVACSCPSCDCF